VKDRICIEVYAIIIKICTIVVVPDPKRNHFRYGTRKLVLENIQMNIGAGEKIALVGESGSGKTTLSKLLMNFYPWEKGEIFIGDYNLKDINLEALRSRIAYISQDIFLFSGTIRENLELGNEDATLEDIIEACHLSKADEFINQLPLRYETMLEENGANLSGGQKQRLAIARALLKKPDILIMDEATSNLDSITEKAIEKTINNLSKNITTIIIAHRLSTIMRYDKIFVMEQGKFIEQGVHTRN
jgi:ABC-type multidrug transport system fused ATPase/permease subunit